MHTATRDELFELGQLTADLLGQFVEIQDGIRSWRVIAFVPVSFDQHARDAHAICESLDSVLERLEPLACVIRADTMEDDFVQALGHYLCALRNSVSAYEYLTRVMDHHSRKQRFREHIVFFACAATSTEQWTIIAGAAQCFRKLGTRSKTPNRAAVLSSFA